MYEHMLTPSYYQANADASEIQLYACISRQEENRRRADKAEEIIAWTKASASREAEVLQTRHREETKQAEFQTRCHAQQAASSAAQAEKARGLLGEFASELHDLTVHNLPLSPALVSLAPALAAAAAAARPPPPPLPVRASAIALGLIQWHSPGNAQSAARHAPKDGD